MTLDPKGHLAAYAKACELTADGGVSVNSYVESIITAYLVASQEPAPVADAWLVINGPDGQCAKVVIGFENMKREVVAAVFGDADDDSEEAQQMRDRLETLSDWDGDRWSISWSFEDGYLNVQRITHFYAAPVPPVVGGAREALRERLERCAARLEALETLPKPYDLYYAVKNEGEGTGWSYRCAHIGVTDIRAAAAALASSVAMRGEQDLVLVPRSDIEFVVTLANRNEQSAEGDRLAALLSGAVARALPSAPAGGSNE